MSETSQLLHGGGMCANPEKSDDEIDHPLTYHIYIGHIGHTNESCSLVESSRN